MAILDKNFLAHVVQSGVQYQYTPPPDWQGLAKNWDHFHDPDFRAFAAQHEISPETVITVRSCGSNAFSVGKVS